jgi:hypothetical protein
MTMTKSRKPHDSRRAPESVCNGMADLRMLAKRLGGTVEKDGVGGYEIVAPPDCRWIDAEVQCYVLPLSEYPRAERLELIRECFDMIQAGHEPYPPSQAIGEIMERARLESDRPVGSDHPGWKTIKLAPAEAELWDWACSPMHDFWGPDSLDRSEGDGWGRYYDEPPAIVEAKDGIGRIADDRNVAEDLIYRVERQMEDMAVTEIQDNDPGSPARMKAIAAIGTGKRIAAKVRNAFGMTED